MIINQEVTIVNDVSKSGFGRRQVKQPQQIGQPEQQESIAHQMAILGTDFSILPSHS